MNTDTITPGMRVRLTGAAAPYVVDYVRDSGTVVTHRDILSGTGVTVYADPERVEAWGDADTLAYVERLQGEADVWSRHASALHRNVEATRRHLGLTPSLLEALEA